MAVPNCLPSAFVACDGPEYLGSALLIEDDLPLRPALTPWIAALWVEPDFRRRGIAFRLIRSAVSAAAQIGYTDCYLNATDENSPYYEQRGFDRIESAVGDVNVFRISTGDHCA
ncbi:GNAT family N-acetyltransferase [Jannaschia marina]|uniref:GNAT family N-acetyltransferase n=1 Tax=Jannaschia marina TaxID=2741674 RepID=UPI0015CADDB3